MTKQKEYKKRNKEQFYTSTSCVNFVMQTCFIFLRKYNIKLNNKNIFIEPSAGSGSFVKWLREHNCNNILAYDIDPKAEGIAKQNFYKLKLNFDSKFVSVGNPPFGYKAKIATKFINKCLSFSDIVIFILPIQFNRYNTQKQIKPSAKLIYTSLPLPRNSFIYKNKPYSVNCIFQIWVNDKIKFSKFKNLRLRIAPENKHPDFKTWIYNNTKATLKFFNKQKYKWDFAIVRQGYYDYSKIITNPKELKKTRQYLFVKFINPRSKLIFKKINFVELAESNTSIKGFSNTDLVKKYNELVEQQNETLRITNRNTKK